MNTPIAQVPKTKICQCGSMVSEQEVLHSSWTPGAGMRVLICTNCSKMSASARASARASASASVSAR